MLTDLHTRVIANAYRLVGATAGDDHLALRTAAERNRARVRIGAPVRVADALPAIPDALLTEKNIDAALARLLVPRLRLEERVFMPPRADTGDAMVLRHREALSFWKHATGRTAARNWIALTGDDAFWQYLVSTDRALPRVQAADVAAVRRALPDLLLGSTVATVKAALASDAFFEVERAVHFVQAGWPDDASVEHNGAIIRALAVKFETVCTPLDPRNCRDALPLAKKCIAPLWGLVRNLNLEDMFLDERDAVCSDLLDVLKSSAGDPDLREAARQAWLATLLLFVGTEAMREYEAVGRLLAPPPLVTKPAPVSPPTPAPVTNVVPVSASVAAVAPPPALQETTGDICRRHGCAPFEDGVCMWCWNEAAQPEVTQRRSRAWNYVRRYCIEPLTIIFVYSLLIFLLAYPIVLSTLVFYVFVAWMAWHLVREGWAFVRSLNGRAGEFVGYVGAVVCVIGLPAAVILTQSSPGSTVAAIDEASTPRPTVYGEKLDADYPPPMRDLAAKSRARARAEQALEAERRSRVADETMSEQTAGVAQAPSRPPLSSFERGDGEDIPIPEGAEPDDEDNEEAAVESYDDTESEDVEQNDDTESDYGADEATEEAEW